MTRDEIVEVMARSISPKDFEEPRRDFYKFRRDYALEDARAALTALEAAGLVVVPKEPTEAMVKTRLAIKFTDATGGLHFNAERTEAKVEFMPHHLRDIYASMIAAAKGETP